jgi:hypothetical protein
MAGFAVTTEDLVFCVHRKLFHICPAKKYIEGSTARQIIRRKCRDIIWVLAGRSAWTL